MEQTPTSPENAQMPIYYMIIVHQRMAFSPVDSSSAVAIAVAVVAGGGGGGGGIATISGIAVLLIFHG